jgi:hypothetical protein
MTGPRIRIVDVRHTLEGLTVHLPRGLSRLRLPLCERISLTAASYGVASSVGWFKGRGRQKAKKTLGIPQSKLVRTVLSLGYPTSPPEGGHLALPKGRKPLPELVYEERYGLRRASSEGTDVDGARSS